MKATTSLLVAGVVLGSGVLGFAEPLAQVDTPTTIHIAIPKDVTIREGVAEVHFIGRRTSTSPVTCAPGTPQPQTVVVVHPTGDFAAQITGVLAFHDDEIPMGTRYRISDIHGRSACNTELDLYVAELE